MMGCVKITSTMTGELFYILGVEDAEEGVKLCEDFVKAVEDDKTEEFYASVSRHGHEIAEWEDMVVEPMVVASAKFRF